MFKNTKLNKTYNFLLKLLIISTSFGYIIYQLFYNENYQKVFDAFVSDFSSRSLIMMMTLMLLMMLVNWSIEAYKWRSLIIKIEKISFAKAFKAILAGLSVSTFSPNRIGDFLGRVFILQKANPWKAIFISILCSMSQLMITLFMGSVSIIIYILAFTHKQDIFSSYILWIFIGLLVFANFLLFSVFFNVSFISKLLYKIISDKWIKIKKYLRVYSYFKFTELRNVLLFSLLRYLVFCTQFFLLLRFFGVPLHIFEGFLMISLIYFILSVIPSMTLAEIGIRGSVAVAVFDYYFNTTLNLNVHFNFGVVAATSVLWLINIALPALIGNIFVLKLHFFKVK
ncbi:MAG: lysylphosphatidylglycerol synthase domain-containing protein [Bacteroidetes bacterium]|nr:lysylphosphatidylglycerol synthase domain-containing protein [Bacteroidota bacterium]